MRGVSVVLAMILAGLALGAGPGIASAQTAPRAAVQAPSAEAFARRIVARLNDRGPAWGVPDTTAWYDPVWLRLVRDNEALAQARGVDSLYDAAAICQCQDEGGTYRLLSVTGRRDGRAEARMRFSQDGGGDPVAYTVVLARIGGGWRIEDVVSNGYSTRAFLVTHVACLRAARTRPAAERCTAP